MKCFQNVRCKHEHRPIISFCLFYAPWCLYCCLCESFDLIFSAPCIYGIYIILEMLLDAAIVASCNLPTPCKIVSCGSSLVWRFYFALYTKQITVNTMILYCIYFRARQIYKQVYSLFVYANAFCGHSHKLSCFDADCNRMNHLRFVTIYGS